METPAHESPPHDRPAGPDGTAQLLAQPGVRAVHLRLPLFLLLLLGAANGGSYLPGHIRQIKVLVPSILAFGVIAAAYANLGAKMAVLRHDGVLKRSGPPRCRPGPT